MFKTNRLYKIITARNGCKGIETAVVEYLGDAEGNATNGLMDYESNVCEVKVIKSNGLDAQIDEIWCINKDCVYEELKDIETNSKPSWKNTLNCKNIFPLNFYKCIELANSINYPFICFNGLIYLTLGANYTMPLGNESELGG